MWEKKKEKGPQRKGICKRVYIRRPKKPNSAKRKVAEIWIRRTGEKVVAYIPDIGTTVKEHGKVLIRGGRVRDLPGVKNKCVLSRKYDVTLNKKRKKRRSVYGIKKERKEEWKE